jgi:hypothetical protein
VCGFAEFALAPGRGADVVVDVVAGTRFDVRFDTGIPRPAGPQLPSGEQIGGTEIQLRAMDPSGRTVMLGATMLTTREPHPMVLPSNATRLEASSETGWSGSVAVPPGTTGELVLPVRRKP